MVIPEILDFPRAAIIPRSQLPLRLLRPTAVLLREKSAYPLLLETELESGPQLLLPECWRDLLPQAGVLISSAISGGSFRQRLEDALLAAPKRCWLLVEPASMVFPLPCPTGCGQPVSPPQAHNGFYSEALCCYYTHSAEDETGSFTLFDTEDTLQRKLELARDLGFCGWVSSDYSADD